MTDPQEPTPAQPASEPTAEAPARRRPRSPKHRLAAPPTGTTWGGPPTAPPAGWGQPTPPATPPPAAPGGWSQPGATAPGWAMTAAPSTQPQGSLMVTLAGVVLLVIGVLVGLAGIGLMAIGLVARAAFETALQNADPAGYSVDAVRIVEGFFLVLGVIVAVYGLGELIAGHRGAPQAPVGAPAGRPAVVHRRPADDARGPWRGGLAAGRHRWRPGGLRRIRGGLLVRGRGPGARRAGVPPRLRRRL